MAVKSRLGHVELRGSGSIVDIASIPCHCAAAYLAGELLSDNSFSPTRSWTPPASNAFWIDLSENRFEAETALQNAGADQFAMFCVKITGAIRGDKFMVTDPGNNNSLFSFTRFEAEKPDFFLREFPFIAREARRDPTLFAEGQEALLRGIVDLQVAVPVGGKTITVRVRKGTDNPSIEVKHPVTEATFMTLPVASLSNVPKLIESVAKHLALHPQGMDSLLDSEPART